MKRIMRDESGSVFATDEWADVDVDGDVTVDVMNVWPVGGGAGGGRGPALTCRPTRKGYRPVRKAVREGVHVGWT